MTLTKPTLTLLLFFTIFSATPAWCNQRANLMGSDSLSGKRPKDRDAIIINEATTIDIRDQKAYLILFNFTKKIQFKVFNPAGVKKMSTFVLPENFDPTYISHFPKARNYRSLYSRLKCNYFKCTIISSDGTSKPAEIEQQVETVQSVIVEKDFYGSYPRYIYQIRNLAPGDEVTIEYQYDVPYSDNYKQLSSFRIFLHGALYKEHCALTLIHKQELNMEIQYYNNGDPDSIRQTGVNKVYYWNKDHLAGCIAEPGSIPYLTLPNVVFSIKPSDLIYTLPYSFEQKYVPFYSIMSYARERNHLGIAKSVDQGVTSRQFTEVDQFIASETKDITGDSTGILKLSRIHNRIVDEFQFRNDTNYFKRIDIYDPKFGDDLLGNVIRDLNRYDVYVALILKLGLNYFTTYPCDRRTGEISNMYFEPMYEGDYLFTVLAKNNSLSYIYPKKSQEGYYMNEIPFYFENVKARMVHLDDYQRFKQPISESFRSVKLPNSSLDDNIRKNNVLVTVNTDSLLVSFDARISLSGQYSTITRGVYKFNETDETVNPLYNKKIWELNSNVKYRRCDVKVTTPEFPFSATVNAGYVSSDILHKNNDTLVLNLQNWFNHIIYSNMETFGRQLDFYPDFKGKDTYTYLIRFDKNVAMINPDMNVTISNEFGEYITRIEQVSENTIKVSSYFATLTNVVPAEKVNAVKEIYGKIADLNNLSLSFIAQ